MITLVALLVVVAVLAFLAGQAHGLAVARRRTAGRDEADIAQTAADFGPLTVGLVSRPGARVTLRRIK